jgi:hypothetical protein
VKAAASNLPKNCVKPVAVFGSHGVHVSAAVLRTTGGHERMALYYGSPLHVAEQIVQVSWTALLSG